MKPWLPCTLKVLAPEGRLTQQPQSCKTHPPMRLDMVPDSWSSCSRCWPAALYRARLVPGSGGMPATPSSLAAGNNSSMRCPVLDSCSVISLSLACSLLVDCPMCGGLQACECAWRAKTEATRLAAAAEPLGLGQRPRRHGLLARRPGCNEQGRAAPTSGSGTRRAFDRGQGAQASCPCLA